jgi:hypothetical protein
MEMKAALGFLVRVVVVYGPAFTSNAQPRKITEEEKEFCAEAYHKHCGEYGLESAALRNCMDRNGRAPMPEKSLEAR